MVSKVDIQFSSYKQLHDIFFSEEHTFYTVYSMRNRYCNIFMFGINSVIFVPIGTDVMAKILIHQCGLNEMNTPYNFM